MNTRINRDEFLKLTQTRSQAMKSTAVPVEKEKLREQLENDVAEFLASGRKVRELPGTEFKPRPARSTAESGENEYIP